MKAQIFASRFAILFSGIACLNCICIMVQLQKNPLTGIRISCGNIDGNINDAIAVAWSNYYSHWGTSSGTFFRSPVFLQIFKPYGNGDEFENTDNNLVAVNTHSNLS